MINSVLAKLTDRAFILKRKNKKLRTAVHGHVSHALWEVIRKLRFGYRCTVAMRAHEPASRKTWRAMAESEITETFVTLRHASSHAVKAVPYFTHLRDTVLN